MDPVAFLAGVVLLTAFIVVGAYLVYREGFKAGSSQSMAVYNALEVGKHMDKDAKVSMGYEGPAEGMPGVDADA